MKSSLFLADSLPTYTDEEGGTHPRPGYTQVGTAEDGRAIIHAAPGRKIPRGAELVENGGEREWSWLDLKASVPAVAERVLRAVWERTVDGEKVPASGPQGPARDRGDIPDAIAEDLPPHFWWGDE